MKLTTPQHAMLTNIARIVDSYDGLAPHTAGEWRTIRALERMGLVRFVAPGECGDDCERAGDCPHSVAIFTLTADGHRVVEQEHTP